MAPAVTGTILVTVHPEQISPPVLVPVEVAIATGSSALTALGSFAGALHVEPPSASEAPGKPGEALVWFRKSSGTAMLARAPQPKAERQRHRRNYAEGELSTEQSFYFRGPEWKLNLRAQNLVTFLQMGEGVDEETWLFHARRGDYSRWFETMIKDEELAATARGIEQNGSQGVEDSRKKLREAVESRYTAPA